MDVTIGTIVVLDAVVRLRPFRSSPTHGMLTGRVDPSVGPMAVLALAGATDFDFRHNHLRLRGRVGAVTVRGRGDVSIELGVNSAEIVRPAL